MRQILGLLGVILVLALTSIASATNAESPKIPKNHVLHTWVKHPKPERVTKKFVPPADASSSYIRNVIIPYEASRYGGGPLNDRIWCESSYDDQAVNGKYGGLIQTDGAFWYEAGAWPSVISDHDLGVKMKTKKSVKRAVFKVRRWSNGKKTYNRIAIQHVPRTVIHRGKLPKDADWFHAWAAVRVGQRAVAGVGPTTFWACTHSGTGNY
jgi:hypothetical protein